MKTNSTLYDKYSIDNSIYKKFQILKKDTNPKEKKTFNKAKQDFLKINHKNKLLWSMYYILNDDFENYTTNEFKIEYDFKIKMIELIEKNPDLLKTHKLKKNDIQHDLFHCKEIDIFSLQALCIYNNVSLIYVNGKKYYKLGNNEAKHIILKDNDEFGIYIDASSIKIKYYINNYYNVENFKKPIKSISGYTLDELKDICIKINIQTTDGNTKMTKKELYSKLLALI